ncbi:MAG: DNA recombination/repair protein RecA, partial [Oscillospiraceae bacterium]|nr:DNA recombination/repair protein RecA [Oscillospiraceae bacterium]
LFGKGISRVGEIVDLAVDLNIIQKSGAWFNYNDVKLGQGRDNAKDFLQSNPEIMAEIEGKIKAAAAEEPLAGKKSKKGPAKGAAFVPAEESDEVFDLPDDEFEEFTPSDNLE